MASIFISYRRADGGWAGRLNDALEQHFDLFFDISDIDYGEDFPSRIRKEIEDCRIVLAVIGSEWKSETGLRRLADPKDWVRAELEMAVRLGRSLIPITINQQMPAADSLPWEIRSLAAKNAFPLVHEKWNRDIELLIAHLQKALTQGPEKTSTRRQSSAFLPYLCDRIDQEEDLLELLAEGGLATRTPVVIVHGHKWEEHSGFLDREIERGALVRYLRALDDAKRTALLGGNGEAGAENGIRSIALEWSMGRVAEGFYDKALRRAVKRGVLDDIASDRDLGKWIEGMRQPVVFTLQITWSDYLKCGRALFDGFVAAWASVFAMAGEGGTPLEPPHPAVLWINFTYDLDEQDLRFPEPLSEASRRCAAALRRLEPVNLGHADAWMEKYAEVQRAVAGRETRIRGLFSDDADPAKSVQLHMKTFVESVRDILAQRD